MVFFRQIKKMAAKQPGIIQEAQTNDDIPLPNWEESLLSLEKLDRTSPEIWRESIPGMSGFAPLQDPKEVPPPWHRGLSNDDIAYMQQLGTLSTTSIIMEVKKLHDLAYQLGLEEAKEMTRGTLKIDETKLKIFELIKEVKAHEQKEMLNSEQNIRALFS